MFNFVDDLLCLHRSAHNQAANTDVHHVCCAHRLSVVEYAKKVIHDHRVNGVLTAHHLVSHHKIIVVGLSILGVISAIPEQKQIFGLLCRIT